MEKLRTIYRLRILRGGLLLSIISILWGLGLFVFFKMFPGGMTSHLKSVICDANGITTEAEMDVIFCKLSQASYNFYQAATSAVILGVMSVVFLLVIIRLNGNTQIRKIISWLMGVGIVLYSIAEFYNAMIFVNSTNLSVDSTNQWMLIPGLILLFCGVLLAVIKIIRDITEPVGVD
ncbi:MAG: hypothetical protein U9Q98_00645 [Bacteroidota bacterium]|nr:hypothetical protein [Bacteroidota bacterium]